MHRVVKCVIAQGIDFAAALPQCGHVIEMLSSAIGTAPSPVKLRLSLLIQLAPAVNSSSATDHFLFKFPLGTPLYFYLEHRTKKCEAVFG